jgi:hypothetical protein
MKNPGVNKFFRNPGTDDSSSVLMTEIIPLHQVLKGKTTNSGKKAGVRSKNLDDRELP